MKCSWNIVNIVVSLYGAEGDYTDCGNRAYNYWITMLHLKLILNYPLVKKKIEKFYQIKLTGIGDIIALKINAQFADVSWVLVMGWVV